MTMAILSKCFRCGSTDLKDKESEELTRHGRYVVAMRTTATVCLRCGERYFDRDTMRLFEETRQKVGRGDLEGLRVTGELLEPTPR
jgi:YgiT-type zinc finger domain-containing protein